MRRYPLLAPLLILLGCQVPGPTLPAPTGSPPPGWPAGVRAEAGDLVIGLAPGTALRELPVLPGGPPRVLGSVDLGTTLHLVQLPAGTSLASALAHYRAVPGVVCLAPNGQLGAPVRPSAADAPSDPLYSSQWALGDQATRARALWARHVDTSGVTVAVLDTGIDATHPELMGRVLPGYNFLDGNQDTTDRDGHGTHVAGIIGARGGNRLGIAGVAWDVRLLPVKVMNGQGGSDIGAIAGIKYAVDAGARVLNLSFSGEGSERSLLFDLALDYVTRHGAVAVVAAGNQHRSLSPPANSPAAIAVSATAHRSYETLASFSNFGPGVFMAAPGDDILSTYPGNRYQALSGTSMAAPFVSGAVAVLLAEHPDWTPAQVREALATATDQLPPRDRVDYYGHGRLDLGKLP